LTPGSFYRTLKVLEKSTADRVPIEQVSHNGFHFWPLAATIHSSGKTAENFPPFKMSLSSQLRADLDSVAAALATCDSILNRKTEEQEAAEWLENFSRWAD